MCEAGPRNRARPLRLGTTPVTLRLVTIAVTCEGPGCDETLTGRADRRYHSLACRQAAYRRRRNDDPAPRKVTTVKRGRLTVSVSEAVAGMGWHLRYAVDAAATELADMDLTVVTDVDREDAREQLTICIEILRRARAALGCRNIEERA